MNQGWHHDILFSSTKTYPPTANPSRSMKMTSLKHIVYNIVMYSIYHYISYYTSHKGLSVFVGLRLASPWALTMIMGLSPWPATHLKGHSLMSACTIGSANLRPIKRFASKTLGWLAHSFQNRNMKDSDWAIVKTVKQLWKKEAIVWNFKQDHFLLISFPNIAQRLVVTCTGYHGPSWWYTVVQCPKWSFTLQLPKMIC